MLLSKKNLSSIRKPGTGAIPTDAQLALPERVLQFGTGVFIRGLIDYYIDNANRKNVFNGRVVVVKSTTTGDTEAFEKQDCLYTLIMKSTRDNVELNDAVICSAITRVLNANDEWSTIMLKAHDPLIQTIISNTTETGLVLVKEDNLKAQPPVSFPGKLLAFLLERFNFFKGSVESGMVILPTELIPGNGSKLSGIVNELAMINHLDPAFIEWMNSCCDFCNTLVDRIVPGKLPKDEHQDSEKKFGYEDDLMIMSETYGLWAIESKSARTRDILSFAHVNDGIHVVEDIYKFLELKLRLLNGSHNLSCAVGFIAGFDTVKEAMADKIFGSYMHRLIIEEIAASITGEKISLAEAQEFGEQVLERYRNPHINFKWLDICVQDTAKIRIRAVPIVLYHYKKYGYVPDAISIGFAAYILFMRSVKNDDNTFTGNSNGRKYQINDDFAAALNNKWKAFSGLALVNAVLGDRLLWDTDLSILHGFPEKVQMHIKTLEQEGFSGVMKKTQTKSGSL